MTPVIKLLIETLIELLVLPAIEQRFADSVPGEVLKAATKRVTAIITEAQAGDYATLKKLVLYSVDEAIRHYEERPK